MTDENTNEEKSSIYIEFKDIGSVEIVGYQMENVSPLQILALSAFLEFEGKSVLSVQRQAQVQAQFERQQKQKIAVPNSTIEIGK
ncbi:hypothetical protein LCGC14_1132800 [marine sediment metagenome]|uniref:Uncharacterized protein n=1 Tax=marine sediment metagenome TaxID=412755 RepID=A0A0F9M0L7_9ZZZZ